MQKSIRKKFILYIVPIVVLVSTTSFHLSMVNSRKIVEQETYQAIDAEQDEQSKAIEDAITNVQSTTDIFASSVGSTYENLYANIYNKIITNMLYQDNNLRSAGVWFEPYLNSDKQKTERYFVQNLNGLFVANEDYTSEEFDYLNHELYIRCKNTNESFFTDAIYHDLTKSYTITYFAPINKPNGEFIGCITTSFDIKHLKNIIDKYNNKAIDFYILDSTGVFIGHSDLDLVTSHTNIADYHENFDDYAETILSTDTGVLTLTENGEKNYIYFDTVSEFNWKLIYEIPSSYINQPLIRLIAINFIICTASIISLITLIFYVTNRFLYKPLLLLSDDFNNIANNDYDSNIPKQLMDTDTEFSHIGKTLEQMKSNLLDYKNKLEESNSLLVENEKTLKEGSNYVNTIISALPIMMFVFDRNGYINDLHGMTPFSNRPKKFYIGKHYNELLGEDISTCIGLEDFLNIIKTVDYSDGVIHTEISALVDGEREYFEHSLTVGPSNTVISLCRRTTDTVNHMQDMKYLNQFDELTGLYNTRSFIEMINKHTLNSSLPISIIVCDVNGLKGINDKYGFEEGDKLLLDLTDTLNAIDVKNKTVARVAGDEFAVILPNTTKEEAEKLIDEINTMCLLCKTSKYSFSIGFGVDTALSEENSLLHLIKSAEELLYKQKVYTSSGKKDNSIGIINNVLLAKNEREQMHSNRVSELCFEMSKALGWSNIEQSKMKTAGLLHDIGKIGIPETLLNKPGALTDEEYKILCTHPEVGYRILQSFENMKDLSEYAYSHHEKWDGSGYPRKLKGTEIPVEARILAIADTYDAMTSSRSYRDGLPREVAIRELIRCKNSQFDPELVDIFVVKVLDEKLEDYQG